MDVRSSGWAALLPADLRDITKSTTAAARAAWARDMRADQVRCEAGLAIRRQYPGSTPLSSISAAEPPRRSVKAWWQEEAAE